ncbi:ATP-binding cassette domain-containing protein [Umezawaea sp. NPDC059074]|uniref:ATP-binding cassette domain-containing protein n=1 Tax=Umezawaea sp. NPDC059074 TaxID=3346716 RepID=UPI0036BEE766
MTSDDLVVSAGERRWTFGPGVVVRVGRGPFNDVVLDDPAVSRDHLRVEFDGGWVVRDQGTSGGTWLGGRRVVEHRVVDEAVVRLSEVVDVGFRVGRAASVVGIGRGPDNDVVLDDPLVSRRHATARRSGDGWLVTDLGGLNRTLVNGVEIAGDAFVGVGDVLTVGSTDVVVSASGFTPVPVAEQHLVVDGVSFSLPDGKRLLSDVGIDIRPGELIAVVGPSGAGKSTLLKVMTGELTPSSGRVTYDGLDVRGSVRSRIGVVPQDDVLHLKLSARKVLSYAARLRLPADTGRDERRRVVADALAEVDLREQAGTKVRSMSGGQRKRVSIAMELLTSPPLLLLDEPTSGLDPNLDKQIMGSLRDIADSGRSVVVVTHNPENLARCDRILLLAPGGVPFFLGAPDELMVRFGSAGWPEIFEAAAQHRPPEGTLTDAVRPPTATADVPQPLRSWPRQAATLVARHTRLIAADLGYAAFLLLMPLVLAGLALAVPGSAGLGPPDPTDPAEPTQMLVLLFVGAAFTGGACGAREIVAERAIFLRERAAGLRPRAYAAGKVVVFGVIAAVQSALLVGGAVLAKPGPSGGVVLGGHPVLELGIALWLTAFASCSMALYASALVRSAEQVMPVLVVVVMAQLVLCGGMIPVTGRPVLDQLSWLTPSRWGYAAGASTVDVLAIVPGVPDDDLWRHSAPWWGLSAAALVALALVFVLLLVRRLTRLRAR